METTQAAQGRAAGILMHISSIPGPAYIGDAGPAAKAFADFLFSSNQTLWQMLPIHPVGADQGFSPYSSSSAMAGNYLFISAEILLRDGLIDKEDIALPETDHPGVVNYEAAILYKNKILSKAYTRWHNMAVAEEQKRFHDYCKKEQYWLEDYALYAVIKEEQNGAAWYQWPAELKLRDEKTLAQFASANRAKLLYEKWKQMIFQDQWQELKLYCHQLHIQLLGDVPIYVAHDSADVWSHPGIFTVNDTGALTHVAGVPPDLFNDEGQLWGMPLFKWDVLKTRGYDWWKKRLQKNLENFDYLRLDHFRAFASYWEVPAGASSAKKGSWQPGPGLDFFHAIQSALGHLPFVAEDLGEIDEPVYALRDALHLPGMNVLQFAFGEDMPESPYLPHHHITNAVAYTGTHDNNTTVGWYQDMKKTEKKNLKEYTGMPVNAKNVSEILCRMAYMSISKWVILPIQDVLSLDASARMNMPASAKDNWKWRLTAGQLTSSATARLNNWCFYYSRARKLR